MVSLLVLSVLARSEYVMRGVTTEPYWHPNATPDLVDPTFHWIGDMVRVRAEGDSAKHIRLSDGSTMLLKPGATFTYGVDPLQGDPRYMVGTVEGEVYLMLHSARVWRVVAGARTATLPAGNHWIRSGAGEKAFGGFRELPGAKPLERRVERWGGNPGCGRQAVKRRLTPLV